MNDYDENEVWPVAQEPDTAQISPTDPERMVIRIPDGLADRSEDNRLARDLIRIFRSADYVSWESGQLGVLDDTVVLLEGEHRDEPLRESRVAGYVVAVNRFLGVLIWNMDDQTRDEYLGHLDGLVDEWESCPTPWYEEN